MAYNSEYNPDALPAHAEPDQAAAMLSGYSPRPAVPMQQQSRPQAHPQSSGGRPAQTGYKKPQPPIPTFSGSPPGGSGRLPGPSPFGPPPGQGPRSPQTNYPPNPSPQQQPQYPPRQSSYPSATFAQHSLPPSNYGHGPPPSAHHSRPAVQHRPPPTPAPLPASHPPSAGSAASEGGAPSLYSLFLAVDADGSGLLSETELRSALVNGDFTSFDAVTVRMMIRMFSGAAHPGSLDFDEFRGLWGFLAAWRELFDRFDEDRSGTISLDEYTKALVAFGYRLTPAFVATLFRAFDRGRSHMGFDLFVQSCISLKRMTDGFKSYDDDRDGYVTLSFEEFLTEILRHR